MKSIPVLEKTQSRQQLSPEKLRQRRKTMRDLGLVSDRLGEVCEAVLKLKEKEADHSAQEIVSNNLVEIRADTRVQTIVKNGTKQSNNIKKWNKIGIIELGITS